MNLSKDNNLLHAVRYCYQCCDRKYCIQGNKQSNFREKIRLFLIAIAIGMMCSTIASWSIFVMVILLITEILNKLLFKKSPHKIDLNQVEYYLINLTNIIQVLSLELYYVSPKIKVLHVKLEIAIEDVAAHDRLKKQIKSDLWQKFGVTETLIDITSRINKTCRELDFQKNFILKDKPYNLDSIQLKFQPYLNLKRQSSIDLN